MDKRTLAQALVFYAEEKQKHHVAYMVAKESEELSKKENDDLNISMAAGAADTKIVKGKFKPGARYLVCRGEEFPFCYVKPDIIGEYSSHWPHDFCYLYKL